MNIVRKLRPGQPGTKKWVNQYGEKLLCVRYRYNRDESQKLKTVEIIVEKSRWEPDGERIPHNKMVDLHIKYGEISLGKLVKSAGGRWNKEKKLWELAYGEAVALGLKERIVSGSKRNV
ncbi:MAG: hypothetical protein P8184_18760 [Calditrichia bacterium]